MDETLSDDFTWYPETRIELRDWLRPDIEALAERYRHHTSAAPTRVELVIVDDRGDTKQLNFVLDQRLAD